MRKQLAVAKRWLRFWARSVLSRSQWPQRRLPKRLQLHEPSVKRKRVRRGLRRLVVATVEIVEIVAVAETVETAVAVVAETVEIAVAVVAAETVVDRSKQWQSYV